MKHFMNKFALILLSVFVFVYHTNTLASLINVGDTEHITLFANVNGDPAVNHSWGVQIQLTAGSYNMYLDDPLWNFGIFGYRNDLVGGIFIYDDLFQSIIHIPDREGTNPNLIQRSYDFTVTRDMTAYSGVADQYLFDNSGTPDFTLTKTENYNIP